MAVNSAWDVGAQSIASPIPMIGLAKGLFGLRAGKSQRSFERARSQAAVDEAQRNSDEFNQNAPINQARLSQSLASRGVGNSSIATQDTTNLTATQGRQRAALQSNLEMARSAKSMMRRQQKYQHRMGPLNFYEQLIARTGQMMGSPQELGAQNQARGIGNSAEQGAVSGMTEGMGGMAGMFG